MKELLYLLRAMQIYSHNCHNLVKGPLFFGDHDFFGGTYKSLDTDYDSVAERIVGLYGEEPLQLQSILSRSASIIADAPSIGVEDNKIYFQYQLGLEDKLCNIVYQILEKSVTAGTEQLITEICNKAESRKYFIKQRLK